RPLRSRCRVNRRPGTQRDFEGRVTKILVCEDDQVARELLVEILDREGYRVEAHASGDEAVARAGKQEYDLVISDVRMGEGAGGMEVLAAFQKSAPQTPIIPITAFGDVSGAMQ